MNDKILNFNDWSKNETILEPDENGQLIEAEWAYVKDHHPTKYFMEDDNEWVWVIKNKDKNACILCQSCDEEKVKEVMAILQGKIT